MRSARVRQDSTGVHAAIGDEDEEHGTFLPTFDSPNAEPPHRGGGLKDDNTGTSECIATSMEGPVAESTPEFCTPPVAPTPGSAGPEISDDFRQLLARQRGHAIDSRLAEHEVDAGSSDSGEEISAPATPVTPVPVSPATIPAAAVESQTASSGSTRQDDEPSPRVPFRNKSASTGGQFGGATKFPARAANRFKKLPTGGKFLAVMIALMAVFVPANLLVGGGGDQPAPTKPTAAQPSMIETPVAVPAATEDGNLLPQTVNAACPDGSSSPNFAFSQDNSEAWICARAFGIDGAILDTTFKSPVVINSVMIVPGFNYVEPSGMDRWTEHRVVTRVLWRIGDKQFVQAINPTRTGATVQIPGVATQRLSLTVLETAEPEGGRQQTTGSILKNTAGSQDSFAVSQIQITGHNA
ncbi:hypothetical protein EEB14_33950 [Rhodococcus sp. WS4]|nr:hypothetical protein EEB14_33950 [Rhodococcus sp. WS4]